MPNIPSNSLCGNFVSSTPNKKAIILPFPTSQVTLHFGKFLKDQPSRNTLHPLHHLSQTLARGNRQQDRHMIVQDFLGINRQPIPLSHLLKNLLQSLRYALFQYHPTIFRHSHHMIFEIVNRAPSAFETHAGENTRRSPLRGLALFLPSAS